MYKYLLVFFTVILYACFPVKNDGLSSEVEIWENDIRQFELLDQNERYSPDAVMFAGSSSIRLWSSIASDMAPYEVIQRGYGGAKLKDFVVYADRIISPHPCSAIVLFIANDITGSEDDKRPRQVAFLFDRLLDIIRGSHPETPVFWIEVTPTPSRWHVWKKASKANRLIKEICSKQKNTYFIGTSHAFLDDKGLPKAEYFLPDMLHLNKDGYKVWSGIIKKELERQRLRLEPQPNGESENLRQ